MSTIINHADKMIRINPTKTYQLQVSKNNGRSWNTLSNTQMFGDFQSLMSSGSEIIATTSKGVYASKNDGRSWNKRS